MIRFLLAIFWVSLAVLPAHAQPNTPRFVDLKAPDGANLKASFFAAARPGPGVILLHQCNRQRKVWDDLARQLSTAGINVLTLDLRGYGDSDGVAFDKGTPQQLQEQGRHWPDDIDMAFAFLTSQPGVKKDVIGAGGASCGVNNSVQLARRHPAQIKSLVLLSGPADLNGRKFVRESQIPVLASVAEDDEFKPSIEATELVYALSPATGKRFLHYDKGGHGADMFKVHPELRDAIVDWYRTTLIKTPGRAPASKDPGPASAGVQMLALLDQPGGAEQASVKLRQARKTNPNATPFDEGNVNTMGYEHIASGDVKGAIEILNLNAEAFPNSPNAYDSLGDAYVAGGQKELARENAKKALELLASDAADPEARKKAIRESAEQKLKQLGASSEPGDKR